MPHVNDRIFFSFNTKQFSKQLKVASLDYNFLFILLYKSLKVKMFKES